jgi:uncharacterized protein YbaP (TraB family)/uncharacterized glyoxalase superfamily protein PhnB
VVRDPAERNAQSGVQALMIALRVLALSLLAVAATATAADSPFFWQVQGPHAVHYLQGSVHMLPADAAQVPPALESAYNAAEGLVFESDIAALSSPELQAQLLDAAKDPSGLRAKIKPALYQKLQKRAGEWEMPPNVCDSFKAWFCAMTMEVLSAAHAGFSADNGIDQRFYARAQADAKSISWLEEPSQQLGLFTDMPDSLGAQFLAATLDELTDASLGPDLLVKTWQNGDVGGMEKVLRDFRTRYPEAYVRLIANRNQAWVPKLTQIIARGKTQLVIAGAAHWIGPDGVVAALKARGYDVRPVALTTAVTTASRDPRAAGSPWLMTYLYCRDPAAALKFYEKAFGFAPGIQTLDAQGRLSYAEVKYQDAVIMLGAESPATGRVAPATQKALPSSQFYIYVPDVDALARQATAAGAEVIEPLTDRSFGERTVLLRDSEGYLWMFATKVAKKNKP